ncbi:hypothetical protein NDU88_011174 [Pleurodeles waltl]|uniref:Uncharacterized protein n=1 Tax=Pleurodeles waltl TaxID=8319 RepID=A0AAV7S3G9_PLEWA|nr:hypothetical protein NDU88_011174 [Pleurodeles waltl]
MVLSGPHKRCPQATVQAAASMTAVVASLGIPRLWCEQAMPECGPTGHGASSGSVKSSDDGISETRVAVQSGFMRLCKQKCFDEKLTRRRDGVIPNEADTSGAGHGVV